MNEIENLIASYAQALPERMKELSEVVASSLQALKKGGAPDWAALEFASHKLAGSSGTYGFVHLSEVCGYLEEISAAGSLKNIAPAAVSEHLGRWSNIFQEQGRLATLRQQPTDAPPRLVEPLRRHLEAVTAQKSQKSQRKVA